MFTFIEALVRAIEALMYPRRRNKSGETPDAEDMQRGSRTCVQGCS